MWKVQSNDSSKQLVKDLSEGPVVRCEAESQLNHSPHNPSAFRYGPATAPGTSRNPLCEGLEWCKVELSFALRWFTLRLGMDFIIIIIL